MMTPKIQDFDGYEDLDELVLSVWPAEWPGRSWVDLDDVGDPDAWLSQNIGEPVSEIILEHESSFESIAEDLAEKYLHEIRGQGLPLPSDFGHSPNYDSWSDEDEKSIRTEFISFLRHWREQALRAVEQHSRKRTGV